MLTGYLGGYRPTAKGFDLIAKERPKKRWSDLAELLEKFEPKLAKAILTALEKQRGGLDIDKVADALERGNLEAVLKLIRVDSLEALFDETKRTLNESAWAAGIAAASTIRGFGGVTVVFNQLNRSLVDHLERYEFDLISEIDRNTVAGVRQYMLSGITAGKNPKAIAKEIKQIVGLTDKQAQAVANYRAQLETFHLRRSATGFKLGGKPDKVNGTQVFKPGADGKPMDGVLERRLRDFRYDAQLKAAMKSGKPLTQKQIDTMVGAYARKYRAFRARTIARTEAARTNNLGIQESWRQAVADNKVSETLIRRSWMVAPDERKCEDCAAIPVLNPKGVEMGKPFNTPKGPRMLPPMHPNCRCVVFIREVTTPESE